MMEEVKNLVKSCRHAINKKDYEKALKLSQTILKEDENNYLGLIFNGYSSQALGQLEGAIKAFKKAISCDENNPLGWNGLISYYEKFDDEESKRNLVQSYMKFISLETNANKVFECCQKLCNLCEYGDIHEIIKSLHKCSCRFEDNHNIYETIIKVSEKSQKISDAEVISMVEKCFTILTQSSKESKSDTLISYLKFLYTQEKFIDLFKEVENKKDIFDSSTTSIVWICKIYNQIYVENYDIGDEHRPLIEKFYLQILENTAENAIGLFTKSIFLSERNKMIEAKEILTRICGTTSESLYAWVFLLKLSVSLKLFNESVEAQNFAKKLMKSANCSNKRLIQILDLHYMELLTQSTITEELLKVQKIHDGITDSDIKEKSLKFVILSKINLEQFDEAELLMSNCEAKDPDLCLLNAKLLRKRNCFQEALNLLEKNTSNTWEKWLLIGQLHCDLKSYSKCLIPLLKAAKLNPNQYICYFELGSYLERVNDMKQAIKCYENAFKICKNTELAIKLSQAYCKNNDYEECKKFLTSQASSRITSKNKWAWLQLGLSYLEQEDCPNAITYLRSVVRIEDKNMHGWQALADAYFKTGAFTSALKCYNKSLELGNKTSYPLLQIANIKSMLGYHSEAKTEYEEILSTNSLYVPALKGLAETYMYLARGCYNEQRLGAARNHVQNAIDSLTGAVQQTSGFSCIWKLLADAFLFVAKLPEKYCCVFVSPPLVENRSILDQAELFDLATSCFCKAIGCTDSNTLLWHDLANCYFSHALSIGDSEKREILIDYAAAAAKHCAAEKPGSWEHWNLLGVIYIQKNPPNYVMAQHYLIKAVTVDHNSAVSWANLGTLYLILGDLKLANKAFTEGQRADPNYVNSWIGQAIIAELMDRDEAMDLFRHSIQLGQNQQGCIGYAHWVCKTILSIPPNTYLYSINDMHAIPVACDAMTWYTRRNSEDGCAWNMLGILRERMGLKRETLEAYKNAYHFSPDHRDAAQTNYGRMLAKLGDYPSAIEVFQNIQAATFSSGSGLALALFQNKQYEDSYNAYEEALHWLAEDSTHQSELLVALASMAYMFRGEEAAKSLLHQSIDLEPPSPWSLYAALALALLHEDAGLAQLVLQKLQSLQDDEECQSHYATLVSSMYLLCGDTRGAVRETSRLVHRHPGNSSNWLKLALLLLGAGGRGLSAVKCAQVALRNVEVTEVLGCVSLAFLLVGERKLALVAAQKAVHAYPHLAEGWAILVAVLGERNDREISVGELVCYIEKIGASEEILKWAKTRKRL